MPRPAAVATILSFAIVAVLGATVINANLVSSGIGTQASGSIGVMQMMTQAKDLPEERYDAY